MPATSASNLSTADRRNKAVYWRKRGLTLREIAEKLEVSHTTIKNDLKKELKSLQEQTRVDIEELRQLELERLDTAQQFVSNKLAGDDCLPAVDRWLKISERRSKLLGLDAPIQVQVQQQVESTLDEFIQFLEANISTQAFDEVMAALQANAEAQEKAAVN